MIVIRQHHAVDIQCIRRRRIGRHEHIALCIVAAGIADGFQRCCIELVDAVECILHGGVHRGEPPFIGCAHQSRLVERFKNEMLVIAGEAFRDL